MKVGVDGCFNPSLRKRKLSYSLNLITDPDTPAAEDTFVRISLEKRRKIVHGERDFLPGVLGLFHSVFIDQVLKLTFPFLFTPGTDHGVIEKNELELEPPGFRNLRGLGDDLHLPPWRG